MIYLGDISREILDKHWEYFKNSNGYEKIKEYIYDDALPIRQRLIFKHLNNDLLLKKIVIGKPSELKEIIDKYNSEVINSGIVFPLIAFAFYKDFILPGSWDCIWNRINTEAKKLSNNNIVQARMNYLDKRFSLIENSYGIVNLDRLNIGGLRNRYNKISNRISSSIEDWNTLLKSIFDYSKFIELGRNWNAYKYTTDLGIVVCPYCNRNYIHTVETDTGKTRAELDHFYPKSLYPFLSISIYNLVPSCHICNSNLKGTKNFFKDQHIHPFENSNQNKVKFKIRYTNAEIESIIPSISQFEIDFDFIPDLDYYNKTMINNSLKTFKIKELYNNHKDVAQELIFKSYYYNETKKEELKTILGVDSGIDDNFIDRVVYGNYNQENDFGKRPLAKFTGDLLSKLKK